MLESQAKWPSTDVSLAGQGFGDHSTIQSRDPQVASAVGSKGRLQRLHRYSVIGRCRGAVAITNIDKRPTKGCRRAKRHASNGGHVHQLPGSGRFVARCENGGVVLRNNRLEKFWPPEVRQWEPSSNLCAKYTSSGAGHPGATSTQGRVDGTATLCNHQK